MKIHLRVLLLLAVLPSGVFAHTLPAGTPHDSKRDLTGKSKEYEPPVRHEEQEGCPDNSTELLEGFRDVQYWNNNDPALPVIHKRINQSAIWGD